MVREFRGRFLWKVFAEGFAEGSQKENQSFGCLVFAEGFAEGFRGRFCGRFFSMVREFRGRFLRKVLQKVIIMGNFAEGYHGGLLWKVRICFTFKFIVFPKRVVSGKTMRKVTL